MFKPLSSLSSTLPATTTSNHFSFSGRASSTGASSVPSLRFTVETDIISLIPTPSFPPTWESRIIHTPLVPVHLDLLDTTRKHLPRQIMLAKSTLPSQSKKIKFVGKFAIPLPPLSPFFCQTGPNTNSLFFASCSTSNPALSYPNIPTTSSLLDDEEQSMINQQDEAGNTALIKAVLQNDIDKTYALILSFANPNVQNKEGNTALILAIIHGHIPLGRELIRHPSINILLMNNQQKSAFSYLKDLSCSESWFCQEMENLLAQQVPQDLINFSWENSTLLCAAAANKNVNAVHTLLQRGANPNIPDSYGNTPLMLAIKQHYMLGIAELLPVTTNFDQQDHNGDTALMLAIHLGHIFIAKELLNYSVNMFLTNNAQQNAFTVLAQQGYGRSYPHLLLAKTMVLTAVQCFPSILDIKVDGSHTLTALAAKLDEAIALQILIARGADFTLSDQQGNTPLMLAIQHSHVEIAQLLILLPNEDDPQNVDGDTALMLAIRLRHLSIANLLVASTYRVNIFLANKQGDTAFTLLFHHRLHDTPQEFLLANNILAWTARAISLEQIDCKIEGSNTLLCLAVALRNILVVKHLLDKGANLNIPNNKGNTPIMLAIKQKQLEMAHFLLSQRPDLSWQNQQGKTAYSLALENRWGFLSS